MRRRKVVVTLLLAVLLAGSAVLLVRGQALAAFDLFGRPFDKTYYTGADDTQGANNGFVFVSTPDIKYSGISQDWDTVPMIPSTFINSMHDRLYSSTAINSSRAAAIINMMMGIDGTDNQFSTPSATRWQNGVTVAKNNFDTWSARVMQYDAAGKVDWNATVISNNDRDWLGYGNSSDVPQPDLISIDLVGADNYKAIVFTNPDGSHLNIKKECANLKGEVEPLQDLGTQPTPTPTPTPTPPAPTPSSEPIFKVTGGDVVAGASMATSAGPVQTPCTAAAAEHNTNAGIVSWNDDGSPDYGGAGAQYAALALNYIQDFATKQGTGAGDDLSLANDTASGANPANGLFGGMFGPGGAPCADYWNAHPNQVTPFLGPDVGTWPSNTYYLTGDTTLNTSTIPAGTHITLYVDGDVALTGAGITYAGGTYSSFDNIPDFKLIVHGSIFIGASVTALDGLYAAIPDTGYTTAAASFSNPAKGTISTCSTGFASYNPSQILTNNMAADCNRHLTVTGSVVANQVWLLRDFGSLATKQAAETFTYSPEVWLAPNAAAGGSTATSDYLTIEGLPPVL